MSSSSVVKPAVSQKHPTSKSSPVFSSFYHSTLGEGQTEMDNKEGRTIVLFLSLISRLWTSLLSPFRNSKSSPCHSSNFPCEGSDEGEKNAKYLANNIHNRNHNNHHRTKGPSETFPKDGNHHRDEHHSANNNNINSSQAQSGGRSRQKGKRGKESKGIMNSSDLFKATGVSGSCSRRRQDKCDCIDMAATKLSLTSSSCCPPVGNKERQMGQSGVARDEDNLLKVVLSSFFIFFIAVAIYGNSLQGDFVHDDVVSIVRNADVKMKTQPTVKGAGATQEDRKTGASSSANFSNPDNLSGWWSLWKNDYWGMSMSSPMSHKSYRPLTVLTFRLNYLIGNGLTPVVFHGTNVLIHGLVSLLSFHLCYSVLKMRMASCLLVSGMFALHPIHTEAIAGITGRSDALACLLMLISFLLYHKALSLADEETVKEHPCENCRKTHPSENKRSTSNEVNSGRRAVSSCKGGGERCCDCDTGSRSSLSSSLSSTPTRGDKEERKTLEEETPGGPGVEDVNGSIICDPSDNGRGGRRSSGKMRYLLVFNPWLIASGLVGCSAMLAKETGITILGINLLYDLYTHFHLLRPRRWSLSRLEEQSHSQLIHRVTLLITLVGVSIGFRIAVMNGTFPRFSRQDNPAAYSKSELSRFLTYAFLPVFNFWLIIYPFRLSYDWQMGSIPLIESLWDLRNLASTAFYLFFLLLLKRAFILKVRGFPSGKRQPGKYRWRKWMGDDREWMSSISGTIVFVALLFLSVPFLPASNLLFPVGFVVAERILYTPSLGVCILTVHGLESLMMVIKNVKKNISSRQQSSSHVERSESAESARSAPTSFSESKPKNNKMSRGDMRKVVLFVCLVLLSFGCRTWRRNMVWKSRQALFTSGIKDNPLNAKMHYNYANLQKNVGNITLAIKHYTSAIRLWPEYASAHNNLGTLLTSTSDPSIAEHQFLRAIHGNQAHGGAHFNLGVLYMRKEKYKEAVSHLEECLNIDPSHVEALKYLGACYNILNKTHEAENVFHKLISSDLPPSKLHTNFGVFLKEMGLNSEALTHFLVALTKTSSDIEALIHASKLAYHLGSEKLFQELAERLLSFNFDQGVAHMLAQSYREKGHLLEAQHLFERLASGSDSFYKIHYAQLLIEVRQWTEAERTLREISICREDPYYSYSILLLGQLYERMNKTEEAVEILNCAVDYFCPRETNLCAQLYSQLGNLMHTTGAMISAANYYGLAIKLNPVSVQAHTNIGAIYHLMNEFGQAQYHYNEALKIEPDNLIVLSNIKKLKRALVVSSPSPDSDLSTNKSNG